MYCFCSIVWNRTAQDCDYDWADESGHISYGLDWIKTAFPDWTKQQIIEEGNRIASDWGDWIRKHHEDGTHGFEIFLERMDKKTEALVLKEQDLN